jgi:ABC transporter DrrB family efflux protein
MTEPAIETVKLGKVYAGEVRALDEVSFRTGYGEVFAYLGRNGSGKTTTIRILTTLTAATTGTARVAGHDVARDPAAVRRAIGVTMQHAALDETMTGRELLSFLAALWELPRGAAAARIGEVVDRLGLGGVLDRRIATYSGGTRRRLDLAGALLHRPAVLFLDEPSTGLDPQSRRALWEQVRELRDQGSAIFLTTQYLEEAAQLADRIAVLHGGRLAAEDTPDGLRRPRRAAAAGPRRPAPGPPGLDHPPGRLGRSGPPGARRPGRLRRRHRRVPSRRADPGGRLPGPHRHPVLHRSPGGHGRRPRLEEATMHELVSLARQTRLVFGRSLRAGLREPALAFVFPLAFPLLIIGLFSQIYRRVADLPGFPAGSYLAWMAPAVVLMAAMFGAGHSAMGLVRDLQTGFLDRLRLLPVHPAALLLGRLGFDMARVTTAGLGVLAVAVALGAPLRAGPLGVLTIAVLLAGWSLGYAGLYYVVGLKARSPEALTALVPLFLPISLLSTAYVPAELLPGWVRTAAAVNPYSHVVDGVRAAMTGTLHAGQLATAVIAVTAAVALTQLAAARRFAGLVHRD